MTRSGLRLVVFLAFALLFILLRTQQYLAVDGALRALSVYWLGYPPIGDNNHVLYFVNIFAWTKAGYVLGVESTNPFQFIRVAQAMNGVAAAGAPCCYGPWLIPSTAVLRSRQRRPARTHSRAHFCCTPRTPQNQWWGCYGACSPSSPSRVPLNPGRALSSLWAEDCSSSRWLPTRVWC
jgi:hypothetical protein